MVEIKALACELPVRLGLPFSRLGSADIAREAVVRGVVVAISVTTVWRCLKSDAIKPWMHRSWLFPRVPLFAEKAARVLDLYFRVFEGIPLGPDDYVISSDEKTSIQARHRKFIGVGPLPHQGCGVKSNGLRGFATVFAKTCTKSGIKRFVFSHLRTSVQSADQTMNKKKTRTSIDLPDHNDQLCSVPAGD